jgi:hypothetical protein
MKGSLLYLGNIFSVTNMQFFFPSLFSKKKKNTVLCSLKTLEMLKMQFVDVMDTSLMAKDYGYVHENTTAPVVLFVPMLLVLQCKAISYLFGLNYKCF